MIINLKPEEILRIDNQDYIVQPSPELKNKPYLQDGGIGQVVQLLHAGTNNYYALKIFKKPNPQIIESTTRLEKNRVSKIPGFVAAERTVIVPQKKTYFDLLEKHSYLAYSILMPWMGGYTWLEILGDNHIGNKQKILELTKDTSVFFASKLSQSLSNLEVREFAHCDLCSNNIVVDIKNSDIHLIDIEEMYFPDATHPNNFIGGQDGYRHPKRLKGHQWIREGDRFGGGILISEILSWYNPQIRKISDAESYSDQFEICKDTEKYRLMLSALGEQGGSNLSQIYKKLWNSKSLEDCPKLSDWDKEIQKIIKDRNITQPDLTKDTQFGLDGRIKIGRRHINTLDETKTQSPSATKRTKVNVITPRKQPVPLPGFQPSTDWGTLFLWVIGLIVIVLICLAISTALGSMMYTIDTPSGNSFTQEYVISLVVVPSKTPKQNTTIPSRTPRPTVTRIPFEPYIAIPKCARARVILGDIVTVEKGIDSLFIRSSSDNNPSNNIIGDFVSGQKAEIIAGPECSWEWMMWKIRRLSDGFEGWVAESDGSGFWLRLDN